MTEFCEHLEEYGVQYERAAGAYGALLAQVGRVAEGNADDDSLDLLERLLRDWRDEVVELRRLLVERVKAGDVELPGAVEPEPADAGAGTSPRCVDCGAPLPRLAFPEIGESADAPAVRGQEPAAEPVPA